MTPALDAPLVRRLSWANPFEVARLAPVSAWHRAAYAPSARLRHELARLPLRRAFSAAYAAGLGGTGELVLHSGAAPRRAPFRGRNLQFSALYMPQHAGGYEPAVWATLDALVGADGVFFDVGANWGYFSLALGARPGFRGRIHAFEPVPATFADLESLVRALGLTERVSCHRLALSERDGDGFMRLPDGLHSGVAEVAAAGEATPLRALDGLGLPAPSVVKLDVEGHEASALRGARAALSAARPFVVFESWFRADRPAQAAEPFDLLAGLGYEFFNPCWVVESDGRRYAGSRPAFDPGAPLLLGLVPFSPLARPLLHEQLNVLAAHPARRAELAALFAD